MHEVELAGNAAHGRALHHSVRPAGLSFHLPGDVAQDSDVRPALAEAGKFIDWQKYRLGRLQSEMRTEFKKSAYEKKE